MDGVQDATLGANVGYDVVVVESDKSSSQANAAEIASVQTTLSPPQPDVVVEETSAGVGEPSPEAEPVVVDEIVEVVTSSEFIPVTSSPDVHEVTEESQQSVPEPEPVPEIVEEVAPSACPSTTFYGPWPVFNDYPWLVSLT